MSGATVIQERIGTGAWVPPWVRQQHIARYEWAAQFVKGKTVLDAACGTGYGAGILSKHTMPRRYVGVDASDGAIQIAKGLHLPMEAEFVVADVTRLPFPSETFDVYLSFETIEHLTNLDAYLGEVKRVLRPSGLFAISTPNRELTNPGTSIHDKPFNRFHVREWSWPEFRALAFPSSSHCSFFTQTLFPQSYHRFLSHLARLSPTLAFRAHQFGKVLRAMTGAMPPATVQPLDAAPGEFLLALGIVPADRAQCAFDESPNAGPSERW